MKIVIPSHKRPQITTNSFVNDCIICVPKSQYDEYREYNPNTEIVTHPDSIVGLSPKRQWIYKKFGDVFFLDDDMEGINRIYIDKQNSHRQLRPTPQEMTDWINDLEDIARQAGTSLFGFNKTAHPMSYLGHQPFLFNVYITGGAFGILKDENLFFPDWSEFVAEDYWISALNAYHNRFSIIDCRVAMWFHKTEGNMGGCSDYRTEQSRRESLIFLRKHFGDAIKKKRSAPAKKNPLKYEKRLEIPF